LDQLLVFLRKELQGYYDKIEIVISNNASTDNTDRVARQHMSDPSYPVKIQYNVNVSNLGSIGNILLLPELANGEYIWVMGDDDIYKNGIIDVVYNAIENNDYSYIFLNHCQYQNNPEDGSLIPTMLDGIDINSNDKNILLNIFEKHGTCLMFSSSGIQKRMHVIKLINSDFKPNWADPLMYSLYAASFGKVKLINEIYIENRIGEIHWSDSMRTVFLHDVPYCLFRMYKLGYNKTHLSRMILNYFLSRKRDFISFYVRSIFKSIK
jgi:glycosyltransferase involved in cell wall biosynthesis